MKQKKRQRGFSLLEMMLAMSLTIALTGVVFSLMRQGQQSFVVEGSRSELNQNFRAAMDLVSRDIQAAGAGIPGFLGPVLGVDGGGTNPDVLMVMYGQTAFTPVAVTAPPISSAVQTAVPLTAFTAGTYLIYTVAQPGDISADVHDSAEFGVFDVASTSDIVNITGGKQLTPTARAINFTEQSSTFWDVTNDFPSSAALQVVKVEDVIQYRLSVATSELQRNRNNSGWVTVARGISNFQLRYKTEKFNGATYDTTWQDQIAKSASNNRALLRSVEVTLTAKTQMGMDIDKQGQRYISHTFEVAPRNLVLPGFIPNH